jgi:hypothetical protein
MVTNELTFYLAAAALVVLVESCVKLLNRDSFSITLAVCLTVFAWYFVDSFSQPGAVRLHSSVLDQPKPRASTDFSHRLSLFYAGCSALG